MFESKYAVPRNIDKLISKLKITTDSHNSYIKFLKKYNVIAFDEDGLIIPLTVKVNHFRLK